MRAALGMAAVLAACAFAASCDTFFVEPAPSDFARVDLTHTWAQGVEAAASQQDLAGAYDKLDQIRVVVSGAVSVDTIVPFSPGGEETRVRIDLPTDRSDVDVAIAIELYSAGEVIFSGSQSARIGSGETTEVSVPITPVPTEVVLPESVPTIEAWGEEVQLTGMVIVQTGDTIRNLQFTWQTTNSSVITVSSSGVVRSVGDGTAFVVGSFGGRSDNVRIDVLAVVRSVVVSPATLTLAVSGTAQLTAQPLDKNGNELPRAVRWSSANPSVAVVNAGGLVTGVDDGTTTIAAESNNIRGTATVSVGGGGSPSTISNLSAPLVGTNDDRCPEPSNPTNGPKGSLFLFGFDYTDPNQDVTVGSAVVVFDWVRGPGDSGRLEVTLDERHVNGDPGSGAVGMGICNWFGEASSMDYTVSLRDAGGDSSNRLSVVIQKPSGGNSPTQGTHGAPPPTKPAATGRD